jgi:HAD superfamily hydrolase (TIGR01509 family)
VAGRARFDAVLFDWRGTLALDAPHEWWIREALERCGRVADDESISRTVSALRREERDFAASPEALTVDCSATSHRLATLRTFRRAGLDDDVADALYELDLEPSSHPLFPDVLDALAALRDRGIRIVVVSDIHFDLRPDLAFHGAGDLVDGYVLSFEHGVQKPDPRIFELALDAGGVAAADALMVGDRASRDGAAAALGIATLVYPPERELRPRGLDAVVALCEPPA